MLHPTRAARFLSWQAALRVFTDSHRSARWPAPATASSLFADAADMPPRLRIALFGILRARDLLVRPAPLPNAGGATAPAAAALTELDQAAQHRVPLPAHIVAALSLAARNDTFGAVTIRAYAAAMRAAAAVSAQSEDDDRRALREHRERARREGRFAPSATELARVPVRVGTATVASVAASEWLPAEMWQPVPASRARPAPGTAKLLQSAGVPQSWQGRRPGSRDAESRNGGGGGGGDSGTSQATALQLVRLRAVDSMPAEVLAFAHADGVVGLIWSSVLPAAAAVVAGRERASSAAAAAAAATSGALPLPAPRLDVCAAVAASLAFFAAVFASTDHLLFNEATLADLTRDAVRALDLAGALIVACEGADASAVTAEGASAPPKAATIAAGAAALLSLSACQLTANLSSSLRARGGRAHELSRLLVDSLKRASTTARPSHVVAALAAANAAVASGGGGAASPAHAVASLASVGFGSMVNTTHLHESDVALPVRLAGEWAAAFCNRVPSGWLLSLRTFAQAVALADDERDRLVALRLERFESRVAAMATVARDTSSDAGDGHAQRQELSRADETTLRVVMQRDAAFAAAATAAVLRQVVRTAASVARLIACCPCGYASGSGGGGAAAVSGAAFAHSLLCREHAALSVYATALAHCESAGKRGGGASGGSDEAAAAQAAAQKHHGALGAIRQAIGVRRRRIPFPAPASDASESERRVLAVSEWQWAPTGTLDANGDAAAASLVARNALARAVQRRAVHMTVLGLDATTSLAAPSTVDGAEVQRASGGTVTAAAERASVFSVDDDDADDGCGAGASDDTSPTSPSRRVSNLSRLVADMGSAWGRSASVTSSRNVGLGGGAATGAVRTTNAAKDGGEDNSATAATTTTTTTSSQGAVDAQSPAHIVAPAPPPNALRFRCLAAFSRKTIELVTQDCVSGRPDATRLAIRWLIANAHRTHFVDETAGDAAGGGSGGGDYAAKRRHYEQQQRRQRRVHFDCPVAQAAALGIDLADDPAALPTAQRPDGCMALATPGAAHCRVLPLDPSDALARHFVVVDMAFDALGNGNRSVAMEIETRFGIVPQSVVIAEWVVAAAPLVAWNGSQFAPVTPDETARAVASNPHDGGGGAAIADDVETAVVCVPDALRLLRQECAVWRLNDTSQPRRRA
jgi:hypothetical protein